MSVSLSSVTVPAWLLCMLVPMLLLASAGCGRVGIRLLRSDGTVAYRSDAGTMPDATMPLDADVRDSGMLDASVRDAGSVDASVRDAAVRDAAADAAESGAPQCDATGYKPDNTCGVGYCQTHNTPSTCVNGVESRCMPGAPKSQSDATCDGVDDDCSGAADEDYQATSCGVGYCRSTSVKSRCQSGAEAACQPGAPLSSTDATLDGVDDDCDGQVDEDACKPTSIVHGAGSFMIAPPAHCTTMTVELWGGGGAAGDAQAGYWLNVTGGRGGAGGYARRVVTVSASSLVRLYVGGGGVGCGMPGVGGLAAHSGGAGGTTRAQNGSNGQDGSLTGGAGGSSSNGGNGGRGSLGGGGGGAGDDPGFAPHGSAGGGGAASVLTVDTVTVIAGGGGGGGGAGSDVATAGFSGGNGGSGCSEAGQVSSTQGGGGGGGGVCQGQTTQRGSGRTPYDPASALPSAAAVGGDNAQDCGRGGDGYAVVSFAP